MRDRMGKDLLKNVILSFFLRWRHIAKMLSRVGKIGFLVALLCVITMAVSWNFSLYFLTPLESSLCACNKCLTEDDPWFRELIEKSPKPFMSRMQGTPEEAFNWWKRLQLERGNFNFYSATVSKLLELFPSSPNVVEVQSGRCQSCAVVGNSGNLKGSRHGPLIDYHDIVIRMNHGHTKGYEEDVGTKTTHHVMYPESAVYLDNTTHLVLFPFKIKDLLWLLNTFTPGLAERYNSSSVSRVNPEASSRLDMPGKPLKGGVQEASSSDPTSTDSSHHGGAAALL
ncbi:CMP-N-acetylneuraminate-beta-galactosamide-alpha-2,3-sialyltransferase 1-like isoform 2-T2 [Aulostomus maculatus]